MMAREGRQFTGFSRKTLKFLHGLKAGHLYAGWRKGRQLAGVGVRICAAQIKFNILLTYIL
jgi:hypothetical protein